jgi:hypothetical protein
MKITIRNIVRLVTLVPLGLFLLYCVYFSATHEASPKYNDCGVVVSKSNDEVPIKHGTRTELYLNVQFDKTGFRSIECEPTTYFKYQKGDRVCFDLNQKISISHRIYTSIGWTVMIIGGLVLWVLLAGYIFRND